MTRNEKTGKEPNKTAFAGAREEAAREAAAGEAAAGEMGTVRSDFDERIVAAYEGMEPSDEACDRMLANLKAYEKQRGAAPDQGATAQSGATTQKGADSHVASEQVAATQQNAFPQRDADAQQEAAPRKRLAAWKVALPVAASLAVLGGVGVLAVNAATNSTADHGAASAEVATTGAPAAKTESEPAAEGLGYMDSTAFEADMAYAPMPEPSYFNTEEYNAVDEPGFIATSTRPLSTFGADVDTASYANLRRLVNQGYGLADVFDETAPYQDNNAEEPPYDAYYYGPSYGEGIPKGAVRIEEMLNYFSYDYALPQGEDLFGTTVQLGDCPWNPDTKLLVMGLATNPEVGQATAGRNLVFLIDTSGSMNEPDKMDLLQDSFAELTAQLNDNDRISLVTYSGHEEVVLDGAKGRDERTIQRAIDRLDPEGSTNGEAGLKMAYEVAERNFIEGGVNRIILASDGDLNVGMTSESDLHDFVEGKRDTGIYLSVLGFGAGNYKDTKMETLADAGNGNYHYIDCLDEARKVFGTDLVANLVPLANDVKLQVEFNPAQVKAYRLIGYENRALSDEDFRDDTKDAGDIGPGHQLTVAYEIVTADSKMDIPEADLKYSEGSTGDDESGEWLTCTMRYQPVTQAEGDGFVVAQGQVREQSLVVRTDDLVADPGDDWRFAASIIETGMVLRDSDSKGSATLDSAKKLLVGMDLNAERRGFEELLDRL